MRVNIGCGATPVEVVYSAHMIEHLDRGEARGFLREVRRLLRPGGLVRLAAPDLALQVLVLASVLAHGDARLEAGYRITFGGAGVDFVGASYTFALQARAFGTWNRIRLIQPVLGLVAVCVLWATHPLRLTTALISVIATMAVQFAFAYHYCHRAWLAPGRELLRMVRPLAISAPRRWHRWRR